MSVPAVPAWWRDVERANMEALEAFEGTLDRLETLLCDPGDISAASLGKDIMRWSALLRCAGDASIRLKSGMRLAESRASDAQSSGFIIPVNHNLTPRLEAAISRSVRLSGDIRHRMRIISGEISRRHPRRPRMNQFRDNTPSHVDIHV